MLFRLSSIMPVVAALLPLLYFFPRIDLTGPFAQAAFWIAESGDAAGMPLLAIAMTAQVIGRAGLSGKQRVVEALVIVLALAALLGVEAYLNEHNVKPVFATYRPNIIELTESPSAEAPTLKMSAKDFYAMPTKAMRSEHLKIVLASESAPAISQAVPGHWIAETGYLFHRAICSRQWCSPLRCSPLG